MPSILTTEQRAGFERDFHDSIFGCTGRENQLTAVFELESHRTVCAQVAAVFAERVAYFSDSSHLVVGHGVDHQCHTAYAVALVADFFVMHAFEVAGGFVDVAFDGVCRHVRGLGFFNR